MTTTFELGKRYNTCYGIARVGYVLPTTGLALFTIEHVSAGAQAQGWRNGSKFHAYPQGSGMPITATWELINA